MSNGCLVITKGQGEGKRFLLENLSVFEGGRALGSHVYLKDDSVAHCHFRIYRKDGEYSIYDLGTSKGTLVNGRRAEKTVLADGDRIQIGDVELRFDLEAAPAHPTPSAGPAERAEPPPAPEDEAPPLPPAPVQQQTGRERVAQPSLVIIDGKDKGMTFSLKGKERFKIGRAMSSDLKLSDGKISREHCVVESVRDHHIIIDLESSNGTVVNGERVKKTVLKEGDYIRLGFTMLKYDRV
jgi:pSer/pThr/pTyr-binding forkhead associated (FHA) protein